MTYKFSMKLSFPSTEQDRSKLPKEIRKLLILLETVA